MIISHKSPEKPIGHAAAMSGKDLRITYHSTLYVFTPDVKNRVAQPPPQVLHTPSVQVYRFCCLKTPFLFICVCVCKKASAVESVCVFVCAAITFPSGSGTFINKLCTSST